MTQSIFNLQTGETGPLIKATTPPILRMPLQGKTPTMSVGDQVLSGTKIAVANSNRQGDLHAPLAGTIRDVQPYAMIIEVTGEEKAKEGVRCEDGGEKLISWLKDMGVATDRLFRAATLIINGVPPEPGISIHEPLLRDYRKTLELGLEAVKSIVEPTKMYLVAAQGNQANAFANCTVIHVPPVYPNGLDSLVIKTVTGKESTPGILPENTTILSVKELFFIGRIMETGRPLTQTVMTMAGQNHLVRIGTPVGYLTSELGATVQPGDRVVLGGFMRGLTAVNLEQGVTKEAYGLTILRSDTALATGDDFCLGCGQCEKHCPARIMPGMISRCAEFKLFKRAEAYHIHSCLECGLCGYWCTARRPLLQYIRFAKYELALLAGAELPPEVSPEALAEGGTPC